MFITRLNDDNFGINGTKAEISEFAKKLLNAVSEELPETTFDDENFGKTKIHIQYEPAEKIIEIYESSTKYFDTKIEQLIRLLDSCQNQLKIGDYYVNTDLEGLETTFILDDYFNPAEYTFEEIVDDIKILAKAENTTPLAIVIKLIEICNKPAEAEKGE